MMIFHQDYGGVAVFRYDVITLFCGCGIPLFRYFVIPGYRYYVIPSLRYFGISLFRGGVIP